MFRDRMRINTDQALVKVGNHLGDLSNNDWCVVLVDGVLVDVYR